jgi:transcriptional antiterminator RfaH
MPILASEISVHPANLLDGYTAEESERQWFAVYTKPRQEKALARQLVAKDIPLYLPLVTRQNSIRGKRVRSFFPLFTSYLFMFGTPEERVYTLSTSRVVQAYAARDPVGMTNDLARIRTLIDSGAAVTVESRLEPGQRVRVKNGSLMGMEGTILSRRGEDRLMVGIEFLQQGVSVLISDFQVELV